MIENYTQYQVTKEQLGKFKAAVEALGSTPTSPDIHAVLHQEPKSQ